MIIKHITKIAITNTKGLSSPNIFTNKSLNDGIPKKDRIGGIVNIPVKIPIINIAVTLFLLKNIPPLWSNLLN